MPAWRARAHHLTRNRNFLAKSAAIILSISGLVAILLHVGRQDGDFRIGDPTYPRTDASFDTTLREGAKRLQQLAAPAPARLMAWIRHEAIRWARQVPGKRSSFDSVALRLDDVELSPLIAKHTVSAAQSDAVAAYIRFRFLPDGEARKSALHALAQIARQNPPPLANEMHGEVLEITGQSEEALQAYLRDVSVPDASRARKRAFDLALHQRNGEVLEQLCSDKRVIEETDPPSLWKAAKITGDRWLLFRALWQMQWTRWMQGATVPLALLAAAIWYVILIHTASREPLRWWRYLVGVFAGVASVWLLHWLQGTLDYNSDPADAPTLTHRILQWIMHVGLPEEVAKLALFTIFVPVLLHHKSGVKAALTAGCVGLGFALDENLHYFKDYGPQVAIGRLLTANFMHLSLTGILGWHFYELFRSRFHHATEFLAAFLIIVAAHGFYDFSLGGEAAKWGFDVASMIILALAAKFYLELLHREEGRRVADFAISRTAVFVLGTSLLGGLLMIVMVWERRQLDGITLVLKEMVGVALVGLMYVREWREI